MQSRKSTSGGDLAIKVPSSNSFNPVEAAQPRAIGACRVVVQAQGGVTRLAELRQSGSLKLVFPATHRPDIEAVIVNTAGGLTGGDRFDIASELKCGATLTLTTQAAERAYQAQACEVAKVRADITVGSGASLNWLPQELILFDGSALNRRLKIDLADDARLLMVEPMAFGRTAMGENLGDIRFTDRIRVMRGGRPLYLDGMDLGENAAVHLDRPAVADGANAMASLVYVAPDAAACLDQVRAMLPETAGASLPGADMLVMRLLAADGYMMRRSLIPILDLLSRNTLPTSWRL